MPVLWKRPTDGKISMESINRVTHDGTQNRNTHPYLNWAIKILGFMKMGKLGNTIGHYYLPKFDPLAGLPISPHLRR